MAPARMIVRACLDTGAHNDLFKKIFIYVSLTFYIVYQKHNNIVFLKCLLVHIGKMDIIYRYVKNQLKTATFFEKNFVEEKIV